MRRELYQQASLSVCFLIVRLSSTLTYLFPFLTPLRSEEGKGQPQFCSAPLLGRYQIYSHPYVSRSLTFGLFHPVLQSSLCFTAQTVFAFLLLSGAASRMQSLRAASYTNDVKLLENRAITIMKVKTEGIP